jgi:hypothetical protein
MPQAYVSKMAKKHKTSVGKQERLWDKAKRIAAKAGKKENYGYITGVYKNMIGEKMKTMRYILESHANALKDEMINDAKHHFKNQLETDSDDFNFSLEAAIYWLANDYHSGQSSDGYQILSTSEYTPGRMENNSRHFKNNDSQGEMIYDYLESKYQDEL